MKRWQDDMHRYPPYQYRDKHLVKESNGTLKLPNVSEKETIMGFFLHFTETCMPKSMQVGPALPYWQFLECHGGNVVAWSTVSPFGVD